MSSIDQVLEMELQQQYEIALANLKQRYLDTRNKKDIEKEREDIKEKYERLTSEANDTKLDEKIAAELQREGFEKKFLNNLEFGYNPEFGYYGREHVETNMKRLTDELNNKYHVMICRLKHDYEQSLRGIDEGIDPARNIEYEGQKKIIENDEEIRVCIRNTLFCIKKDREYEAQARKEAETNPRSRNTFPGDWACGHRYGP